MPSSLEEELATNPFLRPQDPDIRATLSKASGRVNAPRSSACQAHFAWLAALSDTP